MVLSVDQCLKGIDKDVDGIHVDEDTGDEEHPRHDTLLEFKFVIAVLVGLS